MTESNTPTTQHVQRTKILLLGRRRSGKSSIRSVLFSGMTARDTFYLERTTRVTRSTHDSVLPLEVIDTPGSSSLAPDDLPSGAALAGYHAIVYVVDIQAQPEEYLPHLVQTVLDVHALKTEGGRGPDMHVFVHKSDTMSDAHYRLDTFRAIQQQLSYELAEAQADTPLTPSQLVSGDTGPPAAPVVHYSLTSVFDTSTHDAFSRVLGRLLTSVSFLEDLMNLWCTQSHASKAFLVDVSTGLYVATDDTPVDAPTLAWMVEYLRLLSSFGRLYTSKASTPARLQTLHLTPSQSNPKPSPSRLTSPAQTPRHIPSSLPSPLHPSSPSPSGVTSPQPDQHAGPTPPRPTFAPCASASFTPLQSTTSSSARRDSPARIPPSTSTSAGVTLSTTNHASTTTGAGSGGSALVYHALSLPPHPHLALVSILPSRVWESRRGLVDYNVVFVGEGVREIVGEEWGARGAK